MPGTFALFESKTKNPHFDNVYDIAPQELLDKAGEITLIDVRQPEEFTGELGHIPDSQLVVLDTLPQRLQEISSDKTIVFICRSGMRSAKAAAFAQENGYASVYNMLGGMLLWNELHLPTIKG